MKAGDKVRITGAEFPDAAEAHEGKTGQLALECPEGWIVVLDKNASSQPMIREKWLRVES